MSNGPSSDPPLPSTASIALAAGILGAVTGYFLAQASSLGLFSRGASSPPSSPTSRKNKKPKRAKESWPNSYDVTLHPDSSDEELMEKLKGGTAGEEEEEEASVDEESEEEEGEPSTFPANTEDCKLVLVVRTDLGMSKGKIAAQASHATLACYTHLLSHSPSPQTPHPLLRRWLRTGQAKIAVQCASEDELLTLQAQALSVGLCARVVRDAGRTQIAAGSATVLGVGPGPKGVVDGVTGGLKLL